MGTSKVLLKVKPTFIMRKHLLDSFVLSIPLLMLVGMIALLGYLLSTFFSIFGYSPVVEGIKMIGLVIIYVILVLLIIAFVVFTILKKKQYENLVYNFYEDRVEYEDGFLNKVQKRIKYINIREIILVRRVWDRIFGLGRICFYGIVLYDILDSEDLYKKNK